MERCNRVLGIGIVMVVEIIMGIQHASKLEFKKGDSHGMVAEIKVQLQRLGYNAIAGAEAEKENGMFDEKLEATVRLYQSSFNLLVTGFLDAPTIQSLSLPRCGREDAPLNLLHPIKLKLWNLIAGKNKWISSRSNLTYTISSTIFSPILSDHNIWSTFVSTFNSLAMVVPLSFREVESLEEAMIKIPFHSDGDGDDDEWVFDFIEGEHGDEDAKMKIDFLHRFLTEDDDVAALYGNPPPGLGPPPPLLPKSCSHFA
ncbi:hypothetical protein SUGI_0039920 [Cryptomeria japonica]|nr:hypothetical protein SUGI_0039920 [Cryptomeria japonica]